MSYTGNKLAGKRQELLNYVSQFFSDLEIEDYDKTVDNIISYLNEIERASNAHYSEKQLKPYILDEFKKMLEDL